MPIKTDIEIAQETPMKHIRDIAKTAGVDEKYLEQYGDYKAKVNYNLLDDMTDKPGGKLVLVTVELTQAARKQAGQLAELGFGSLPICMAKTQYSFSDDQKLLGAPRDFKVTVRNLKVSAGAGFIVALTGDIMTMPGLPKVPSAEKIDVDETGKISGLF